MKKWLFLGTLSLLSLSADSHEPAIGFEIDMRSPYKNPKFHLTLEHQSNLELEDGNMIILHGLSHPYSHKTYHHELGAGFRKFYENFGFGCNFIYANQNLSGFMNHQFIPGVEFFYDNFSLVYNRYLPVRTSVEFKDNLYLFHDVSEISLSYRFSKNLEFSFATNFNHQNKKFGYGGTISAFLFDDWKLSITPYCQPNLRNGLAFSMGYHFGGATKKINRKLVKYHNFFYTSDKKEVKKMDTHIGPFLLPTPGPIILTPAMYDEAGFIIDDPVSTKPQEKVIGSDHKNWWDWFFPTQTKPKT